MACEGGAPFNGAKSRAFKVQGSDVWALPRLSPSSVSDLGGGVSGGSPTTY